MPIAVVGVGIRAPGGVTDTSSYWSALMQARDLTGELPEDRRAAFGSEWCDVITHAGYLRRPFDFDARFFGMSPREARTVDPQHRILLEVAWEAFEDAAIRPNRVAESTGVFVGITGQDYRHWLSGEPNSYWTIGNGHSFAAGRLAHALGLQGPTFALDTACSSSLVAVHNACRALAAGECDAAVAAGVNLILSPRTTREVGRTGALSPDGTSRPFDAAANGFVRGEACGAVILKRLENALRDRDRVRAVIDGTAINQDGRSATFTSPNVESQVRLIRSLLGKTGLAGEDIGYHEAHGTGTPVGDPVEMRAITAGLRPRPSERPLYVGSVKANIGHTESAAGILGLIKALLCLEQKVVPPQARFDTLNPHIDLTGTAVAVPKQAQPWEGDRVSVSSYGMSGTNAYAVLSAAPAPPRLSGAVPGFMISGRTPAVVAELVNRYRDCLAELGESGYPAFAYTATHGRSRHRATVWVDAPTLADAREALAHGTEHARVRRLDESEELPWAEAPAARAVASLPTYPWEHVRHVVPVEERQ
ncbi:Ketoacyl-synthetase C-terminal extension [Sinosporangium album]|uniref:Ketoacyl-synthetase C-terminal extension n=1 Tax=Sinosporangium album TaxID=504805 RepID=A0A1G8EVX4_9ACTN|nr:polyketide synthase [Sinosporangium album]SDH74004.1 Ketoacyl-synthetase C-terminal extension [Sinosporangium album]